MYIVYNYRDLSSFNIEVLSMPFFRFILFISTISNTFLYPAEGIHIVTRSKYLRPYKIYIYILNQRQQKVKQISLSFSAILHSCFLLLHAVYKLDQATFDLNITT